MESAKFNDTVVSSKTTTGLVILCFGRFGVELDSQAIDISSKKLRILLALLAATPELRVERSAAAKLIWSRHAEENALTSLRQALSKLKSLLNTSDRTLIQASRQHIWLENCRSDLRDLYELTEINTQTLEYLKSCWHQSLFGDLSAKEDNIKAWIEQQQLGVAEHFLTLIQRKINSLAGAENTQSEYQALLREKDRILRLYDLTLSKPTQQTEGSSLCQVKEPLAEFILRAEPSTDILKRYAQYLRDKVSNFWLDGVLRRMLDTHDFIELSLDDEQSKIKQPYDIDNLKYPTQSVESKIETLDAFSHYYFENQGQVLILGAPASGKTTLLLKLIEQMMSFRAANSSHAIPIILNAATWGQKGTSLEEWILSELDYRYDIPKQVGKSLLKEQQLIIFIDGVDEIGRDSTQSFFVSANEFIKLHPGFPISFSCRTEEYALCPIKLQVFGALVISDLSPETLQSHIKNTKGKYNFLNELIDREDLRITSPLSVKILKESAQKIKPSDSRNLTTDDLIEIYLETLIPEKGISKHCNKSQTLHYLAHLATMAKGYQQSIFHVESLTGVKAFRPSIGTLYRALTLCIVTSVIAFSVGLMGWLMHDCWSYFFLPIPFAVVGVAVVTVMGESGDKRMLPRVIIDPKSITKDWNTNLPTALYGSISMFACCSFLFGYSYGLIMGGGMALVFLIWMSLDFESPMEPQDSFGKPNEILHRSHINGLTGAVIGAFLGLIADQLLAGDAPPFTLPIFFSALCYFIFGGYSAVQHYVIRCLLAINGHCPLNIVKFLNDCCQHKLLYRVGGGYIFPHAMIQDHLGKKLQNKESRIA
jgi:DNA-binding SARP family transcriptional activator